MRNNNRILKITEVRFPIISFLSNNGDFRKINIRKTLKSLGFQKGDFGFEIIEKKSVFEKVEVVENALAWKNVFSNIKASKQKRATLFFSS